MYFGDIFGWNVVICSLNAATNNMSVIFIKNIIVIKKYIYAYYKPISKKKQDKTNLKK